MKNKIRVYASCFWQPDDLLFSDLKYYGFGKAEWKNIRFVTDAEFDIVIIFTAPHKKHKPFDRKKAVTFLTEPPMSPHHLNTTDTVCPMYLSLPWWISSPRKREIILGSLANQKAELLSAVASEQYWLVGHQKRLQFLYCLDSIVTEGMDIYGKKYTGQIFSQFNNYRSELKDKFDGLIPYEYHFACENSFIPDYFTEKILDPIIAECLCFYDGCTNISEYIDDRAFIKIDVNDIQQSINTIIQSIEQNEFTKRIKYIVNAKKRILTQLNPLNIIWAALNGKDLPKYFKI